MITILNCLFVHDFLNGNLPKSFDNTFTKLSDIRSNGNTVSTINSELGCLFLPNVNTSTYGLNSLIGIQSSAGTLISNYLIMMMLFQCQKNKLKNKIKKHVLSTC